VTEGSLATWSKTPDTLSLPGRLALFLVYISKRWLPGLFGNIPELHRWPEAYLAFKKICRHLKGHRKKLIDNIHKHFEKGGRLSHSLIARENEVFP
jgi:hypothetical protein